MALELRNALGERVGAMLPATMAFDHPTLNALTHWLLADVIAAGKGGEPPGDLPPEAPRAAAGADQGVVLHSSLSVFEETRTVRSSRACICWRRSKGGRGNPTLLLLHGAGANHHYFATLANHLVNHDLLIPSFPGRCGTDGPPLETASEAARWLHELLAELDVPSVVAVGHSYGGVVALELAIMQAALSIDRRPVNGLILIATGPGLPMEPHVRTMLMKRGEAGPTEANLSLLHQTTARTVSEEALRDVARTLALTPMAASASDIAASNSAFSRMDALGGIDLPTLVLAGSADQVAPLRHSHYLRQHIPGSRLSVLEGVGHHPPLEAAEEVARQVDRFFDDISLLVTRQQAHG